MNFKIKSIKKIVFRTTIFFGLSFSILIVAVLCPSFMYGNSTSLHDNIKVYHNQPLNPALVDIIKESYTILEESEIFDPGFEIKVCLNDGSSYPDLIRKIKGEAFAWGFAQNTVLGVEIFPEENYAIWQGRKRKLNELFAHEFTHNYQYNSYGFSTLNFPFWKLEGYCEYVMMSSDKDNDFKKDIQLLQKAEQDGFQDWDWIEFENGFGTTPIYLRSRLTIQYLIELKGMSYDDIIKNEELDENKIKEEMIEWLNSQ